MTFNPIYLNYKNSRQSFETTLSLLQDLLNDLLLPNFKSLKVNGSNSGKVKLCITTFDHKSNYNMTFYDFKSFRNWRPVADNDNFDIEFQKEVDNIESIILSLRQNILSEIIS